MIELEINLDSILTELDGIILTDKDRGLSPIKFVPVRLGTRLTDASGEPSCSRCGHAGTYMADASFCPRCGAQLSLGIPTIGFRGRVVI